MVAFVIDFLSVATLASNVVFIILFLIFLYSRFTNKSPWGRIVRYLKPRAISLSLFFALVATLGSLFLSEVAKYSPCLLCWYQRIFMYPLVFVLGTALFKKTRDVASYVLPLSMVGGLLAAFHYWGQVTYNPFTSCAAIGFSVSCSERFFTHFGYITIPFMAFSAFVYITSLMIIFKKK